MLQQAEFVLDINNKCAVCSEKEGGIPASFARENALIILHRQVFSCHIGDEVTQLLFTFILMSKEGMKCLLHLA